jgi:hypothetical protein
VIFREKSGRTGAIAGDFGDNFPSLNLENIRNFILIGGGLCTDVELPEQNRSLFARPR